MLCVSDVLKRAALGFAILIQAPALVVYGLNLGVWAEVIAPVVTSGYF